MSKAKKAAYAARQKVAAEAASSPSLSPLPNDGGTPKTTKKARTRKQSRGK